MLWKWSIAISRLIPVNSSNDYDTYLHHRVYHLAGEFARHLQKELLTMDIPVGEKDLWNFSDQEVLSAEIAGLCHDLGA